MSASPLDTLWYSHGSAPTPVGLAAQLGWFERVFGPDGIAVKAVHDTDDGVGRAHVDHDRRLSFHQSGSVSPVWARAEGRDTRVIGLVCTEESQQVLTLPKTGIRTVKDLGGRRLGLPRRSSDRFPRLDVRGAAALRGYLLSLATEGLSAGDVSFVQLPHDEDPFAVEHSEGRRAGNGYDDEVFALVRGEVDAIFVEGARGKEVEADLEAREVIQLGKHPDPAVRRQSRLLRPLSVDGALARCHPDIVERILAIAISAGEWAKEHPADTLDLVARQVGSSETFVQRAYPDVHRQLGIDLAEPSVEALQQHTAFLAEHGFVRANFDVRSWIDWAPINALRSRAASRSAPRARDAKRAAVLEGGAKGA
jgi:ABC-type nitrate/sulfonate/bicarbonate transport system substrate-binding protein